MFLLLFSLNIFCQRNLKITGFVYDTNNKLIKDAIVLLKKNKSILEYTNSNNEGFFEFIVDIDIGDILLLEVSHLNYKTKTIKFNENKKFSIFLEERVNKLKEIVIKSEKIKKKDTLKYLVSDITKNQTLTLSNVLKKIPGIEVLDNGQILFQGKAIQKYYIEGIDLLEGRYNLANKGLAVKDVKEIQVLENHQPIRLLDSIKFNDSASINIKLKNKNVLIGNSNIGLGLVHKPLSRNIKTLPMFFSKKIQFIGNLATNNIGVDNRKDLKSLTKDNLKDFILERGINWVNLASTGTPLLPPQYWLDNSTTVSSLNFIGRLNSDLFLKISPTYINNKQYLKVNRKTVFFGINEDIRINEVNKNEFHSNEFNTKIVLEKNSKKKYLKNTIDFLLERIVEAGNINNKAIVQNIKKPKEYIKNIFKTLIPINKTIYTINSRFFWYKNSNSLEVLPGVFKDLLNNEENFEKAEQLVNHSNLFSENSLGFIKKINRINFDNKFYVEYGKQNLNSEININNDILNQSEFINNISLINKTIKVDSDIQYKHKGFKIDTKLSLRNSSIFLDNNLQNLNNKIKRIFFEPKINISKEFGKFLEFSINGSQNYSFGRLNKFFNSYILENYRRILLYNPLIPINKSIRKGFYIRYKNYNKGLFIRSSYTSSNNRRNTSYEYNLKENGNISVNTIEKNLSSKSNFFNFFVEKYFDALNLSINLKANISNNENPSFLNNNIFLNKTKREFYQIKLEYDLFDKLQAFLKTEVYNEKTILNNTIAQIQSRTNNFFGCDYSFNTKTTINLSFSNFNIKTPQNFTNNLLNFSFRNTFRNQKSSLEFKLNNILNNSVFLQVNNNEYYQSISEYNLRPFQILVNYKFHF